MARRSSRRLRIGSALNSVTTPVYLVDGNRRVVFVNTALETLTGWTLAEVGGELCEFNSESEPGTIHELTGSLCPTPDSLNGAAHQLPALFIHRETRERFRRLTYLFPLHDDGEVALILGIVDDEAAPSRTLDSSVVTEVHAELAALRHVLREQYRLDGLIACSPVMLRVAEQIRLASQSRATISITGPAGCGKEHIARVVHYSSAQSASAFVHLDCRRLPPRELQGAIGRLIESDWAELSPVSAIHPGSVYLSEIDHMPREVQQRLLSFVTSERAAAFRSSVRLMSSRENLADSGSAETALLDELHFHLTAIQIQVPPLTERRADLELLMQHFLERHNRNRARQLTGFTDDVRRQFFEYNWPGNIDELREVVGESVSRCDTSVIAEAHLPLRFRMGLDAQSQVPDNSSLGEPLDDLLSRIEREQIEAALSRFDRNKAKAARILGISRASLYRRMQSHGIDES